MGTKKELFDEVNLHLMNDERPSIYLNEISNASLFQEYPFDMLALLKTVEQSKQYHPEGNVWNHTMMVVDEAARVKDRSKRKEAFLWAALLHDIGKTATTKVRKGRITSYDHETVGAELAGKFLHEFTTHEAWIDEVVYLVRWHMQVLFVEKNLPFGDLDEMMKQVDLQEIGLLALCDRLGRIGADRQQVKESIDRFLKTCEKKNL